MTDRTMDCGSVAEAMRRLDERATWLLEHPDLSDDLRARTEGQTIRVCLGVLREAMECRSMHPKVAASIADLRALALAHPRLSEELLDVIAQLRDTEQESDAEGGER